VPKGAPPKQHLVENDAHAPYIHLRGQGGAGPGQAWAWAGQALVGGWRGQRDVWLVGVAPPCTPSIYNSQTACTMQPHPHPLTLLLMIGAALWRTTKHSGGRYQ
jgi:hypothetical protein